MALWHEITFRDDRRQWLVHRHTITGANEHDVTATDKVPHGKEERVYEDAGYVGVENIKNTNLAKLSDRYRRVLANAKA